MLNVWLGSQTPGTITLSEDVYYFARLEEDDLSHY